MCPRAKKKKKPAETLLSNWIFCVSKAVLFLTGFDTRKVYKWKCMIPAQPFPTLREGPHQNATGCSLKAALGKEGSVLHQSTVNRHRAASSRVSEPAVLQPAARYRMPTAATSLMGMRIWPQIKRFRALGAAKDMRVERWLSWPLFFSLGEARLGICRCKAINLFIQMGRLELEVARK